MVISQILHEKVKQKNKTKTDNKVPKLFSLTQAYVLFLSHFLYVILLEKYLCTIFSIYKMVSSFDGVI